MSMMMNKIKLMFGLLLCFGTIQAQDDMVEKANKEAEKAKEKLNSFIDESRKRLESK